MRKKRYTGNSYTVRVKAVQEVYDQYIKTGLSNREIWKRYIWPVYGICESTFYRYISQVLPPEEEDPNQLKPWNNEDSQS